MFYSLAMRIVLVHNFYQRRGGEDQCADQDYQLLKKYGCEVFFYHKHNDEIKKYDIWRKLGLLTTPTWSASAFREISSIIKSFSPDVIHVHNFFPLISPSVFYASEMFGVPIVLTVHTYRMICSNGLFFRNGKVCELCMKNPFFGFLYACYHDSRIMTLPVSLMIFIHRKIRTWSSKIDLFTTPSEFLKNKITQIGIPKEKIVVRPNFISENIEPSGEEREFALFVGRLSEEKGLRILLSAWEKLENMKRFILLKIIGDGPMKDYVIQKVKNLRSVEYIGFVPFSDVLKYMGKALFVILPSVLNETFGRTIIEAYARGTPVLGSNLGAIPEVIKDGETGFVFRPDPDDIVRKVKFAVDNKELLKSLGVKCREEFEKKYSEQVAYKNLMNVYEAVRRSRARR